MKQINNFKKGMDYDSALTEISNEAMRDAVNMSLLENEKFGSNVNMQGTDTLRAMIYNTTGLRVLAAILTNATINGEQARGILYFTYDTAQQSNIHFLNLDNEQLTQIYPDFGARRFNQLGFSYDSVIDAFAWSDRGRHFVYFTDNTNNLRFVEVRDDFRTSLIKELSVRPVNPVDCLEYVEVQTGGSKKAGSYQYLYRRWNSNTCVASAWSNITNAIPIIFDDEACTDITGVDIHGAKIDQKTNKQIKLRINGRDGEFGFDQIQILEIANTTDLKTNPTTGILYTPQEFDRDEIIIAGDEEGVRINLDDVLIDDLPIIGAKTITEKDERIFVGNIKLQNFPMDNGDIALDKAKTIEKSVGDVGFIEYDKIIKSSRGDFTLTVQEDYDNAYKCPDDTVNCKSYWRGEVYPFGVFIYDEFRNGIVCPIDFTPYGKDLFEFQNYDTADSISTNGDEVIVTVPNSTIYQVGDVLSIGGIKRTVLRIINLRQIQVDGGNNVGNSFNISLFYGQKGNQGTSWAWKFPARSDNQFSIFDADNKVKAIGLRLEGLRNWPTWAKGFEIVRRKRKKNILYQTPHVPTIGVQGSSTQGLLDEQGGRELDYSGELDYIHPKIHYHGSAAGIEALDEVKSHWRRLTGPRLPRMIHSISPDYLYNVAGESYDLSSVDGAKTSIIDAIILKRNGRTTETTPIDNVKTEILSLQVNYEALSRSQYYYTREGLTRESGDNT